MHFCPKITFRGEITGQKDFFLKVSFQVLLPSIFVIHVLSCKSKGDYRRRKKFQENYLSYVPKIALKLGRGLSTSIHSGGAPREPGTSLIHPALLLVQASYLLLYFLYKPHTSCSTSCTTLIPPACSKI